MSIVIGGEKAWRKYRKGDIGISYHWIDGEPAMVLFPANRQSSRLVTPFVIKLSIGHQYVNSDGHPNLLHAMSAAVDAAQCLGMAPEMSTVHRIIDAIVEGMPDLVMMPPEPSWASQVPTGPAVGELAIKVDGRTVHEAPVTAPEVTA